MSEISEEQKKNERDKRLELKRNFLHENGFTSQQTMLHDLEVDLVQQTLIQLKEEEENEENKDLVTIGLLNKYIEFVKAFNGGDNSSYETYKNKVREFYSYNCQDDNDFCKEMKKSIIKASTLTKIPISDTPSAPRYIIPKMNLDQKKYTSPGVGGGKRKVSKKSKKSKSRKSKKSKKTKSRRH